MNNLKSRVGFADIDAPPFQSGNFNPQSRLITKRGSAALRKILFQTMFDILKKYERDGHMYIEGFLHDGHDRYELKRLTGKSNRHFAHDKALHEKIVNNNFFSVLPRLADIIKFPPVRGPFHLPHVLVTRK